MNRSDWLKMISRRIKELQKELKRLKWQRDIIALMTDMVNKPNKGERMERVERGIMVMKNDKAWGVSYEDGQITVYDWIDPTGPNAEITNPKFIKRPQDAMSSFALKRNVSYRNELAEAKLVSVERKITVTVLEAVKDAS